MKKSTIKIAGFMMLAMLLGGHNTASAQNFDLNGDGAVDVADMSALITYMAGNPQGATFAFRDNKDAKQGDLGESNGGGAKAIDLGLPSGRKWADKNVGWKKDDYGVYFAWGGLSWANAKGKLYLSGSDPCYDWSHYEHSVGSTWKDVCRYTVEDGAEDAYWYGYGSDGNSTFCGDGLEILNDGPNGDDAASFYWGGKWRMPYASEFQELLEYTDQIWDTDKEELQKGTNPKDVKGIWGCWFIGKNPGRDSLDWSKSKIFLPAAGCIEGNRIEYRNNQYMFQKGKYWAKDHHVHFGHQPTSTAASLFINRKHCCEDEADNYIYFPERQYGFSIRPVQGD